MGAVAARFSLPAASCQGRESAWAEFKGVYETRSFLSLVVMPDLTLTGLVHQSTEMQWTALHRLLFSSSPCHGYPPSLLRIDTISYPACLMSVEEGEAGVNQSPFPPANAGQQEEKKKKGKGTEVHDLGARGRIETQRRK